jgi:hypothetical protein
MNAGSGTPFKVKEGAAMRPAIGLERSFWPAKSTCGSIWYSMIE